MTSIRLLELEDVLFKSSSSIKIAFFLLKPMIPELETKISLSVAIKRLVLLVFFQFDPREKNESVITLGVSVYKKVEYKFIFDF